MSDEPRSTSFRRSLWTLAILGVLTLPLVTPRIYASDEVQYFAYLRSLWFDRDVSFENEYQHFYNAGIAQGAGFHETFLERTTETGRRINFGTIGAPLLWSPFYAAANLWAQARYASGAKIATDGYSQPYIAAVAYGSAFYGWTALALTLLIIRRILGDARLGPVLAIWLGTPLIFYMLIAPPMAHACSAFAIALFIYVWLNARERWSARDLIALGAAAALMTMVREQDAFVAVGPALDWGWTVVRRWRARTPTVTASTATPTATETASAAAREDGVGRLLINGAIGAAAFFVCFLPQLACYLALNGYPGPSRLVGRKMNWMTPHAGGVLLSPEHGLLFWSPLIVLSLAGLALLTLSRDARVPTRPPADAVAPDAAPPDAAHAVLAPAARRWIGVCLLAIVAAEVYVAGSVESWTVAGAFGQRRFVGLSVVFSIGLAALWLRTRTPIHRALVGVLAALCIWWNIGLMAQFGLGLMDRQRLTLRANAYHTFVTIPRLLPDLMRRYVFERRSFYRTPAAPAAAPGRGDVRPQ